MGVVHQQGSCQFSSLFSLLLMWKWHPAFPETGTTLIKLEKHISAARLESTLLGWKSLPVCFFVALVVTAAAAGSSSKLQLRLILWFRRRKEWLFTLTVWAILNFCSAGGGKYVYSSSIQRPFDLFAYLAKVGIKNSSVCLYLCLFYYEVT